MCLAIPAQVVAYLDADRQYASVELAGIRRRVDMSLLTGQDAAEVGDYVLVHVGFALSRISEDEALDTLRLLRELGAAFDEEVAQMDASPFLEAEATP